MKDRYELTSGGVEILDPKTGLRVERKRKARRRNKDGTLTKVMLAEHVRFAERTAAALLELGARQIGEGLRFGLSVVSAGSFELDTIAGPLKVYAFGDWIAACFYDEKRGHEATGHCGYYGRACALSGKWNFHKFNVGLSSDEEDRDGLLLALFLKSVRPILDGGRRSDADGRL